MKPSLSVVIPAYNRATHLVKTLKALTLQNCSHRAFEVIVVNDGSTDETQTVIASLKVSYALRTLDARRDARSNPSAAGARNAGILQASGDIVLFLDCDIIAHPSLVKNHLQFHGKARNLVVLGYRYRATRETPTLDMEDPKAAHSFMWSRPGQWKPDEREDFWQKRTTKITQPPVNWGCLYSHNVSIHRDFILRVGGFDPEFRGCGGEDVELGYRIHKLGGEFVVARDAVGFHQYHERSSDRWRNNFLNIQLIARKHPELKPFCQQVVREWLNLAPQNFTADGALTIREEIFE